MSRRHRVQATVAGAAVAALPLLTLAAVPAQAATPPSRSSMMPAVASYLATRGTTVSVAVYDADTGEEFTYNPSTLHYTASIAKVDILSTLMAHQQATGQPLSYSNQILAQQMIMQSNNTAATELWNEDGGGPGVAAYNAANGGLPSTTMGSGGYWGLTTTTAPDQVQLVKWLAYGDRVLTPDSRAYPLSLMRLVEPTEDWGVSYGVPAGVSVALKNGWLPVGSATNWQVNSIGYINGQGRNYVVAVLTAHDPSMDYGIQTISGVSAILYHHLGGVTAPVPVAAPVGLSPSVAQAYVTKLYPAILQRGVDPAGLAAWSGALEQGTLTPLQVATALTNSGEYHADVVRTAYEAYLGRPADSGGLAAFTGLLARGGTQQQVIASLVASGEFYADSGSTPTGFITRVYERVLHRTPDAAGESTWLHLLSQGVPRTTVAADFLASGEYRTDLVESLYQSALHRAPSTTELDQGITELGQGVNSAQLLAALGAELV